MDIIRPLPFSPVRRVGGKRQLRTKIIPLLPADALAYVEVFAGGAWVLFAKPEHPVEVINDIDGELVNLWRVIKWRPAELLENVQLHLHSREMFGELEAEEIPERDEMARAVRFYLVMRMRFGALEKASWGVTTNEHRQLPVRAAQVRLEAAFRRLQNVYIERQDFEKILKKYDRKTTLFFLDPPYLGEDLYQGTFDLGEHERLAAALRRVKGRFLLTLNDVAEVRRLYDGFNILAVEEQRSVSTSRDAAPVVIVTNYSTEPPRLEGVL
ncbi:MAG: DNA adenine methylase [Acidobacteria bacterium]|nr:DNA adenine methylase [Acidobacteriota bacterium]